MIKYNLTCKSCKLDFDSWFASSLEFERLKKKNLLICHNCNSFKIEKSVMMPNVINKTSTIKEKFSSNKYKSIKKIINRYQKFVKNNFDYVGENFAYEARSIHYKDAKSKKGIYGHASKKDIKELSEEGIETQLIPWINDKEN